MMLPVLSFPVQTNPQGNRLFLLIAVFQLMEDGNMIESEPDLFPVFNELMSLSLNHQQSPTQRKEEEGTRHVPSDGKHITYEAGYPK